MSPTDTRYLFVWLFAVAALLALAFVIGRRALWLIVDLFEWISVKRAERRARQWAELHFYTGSRFYDGRTVTAEHSQKNN